MGKGANALNSLERRPSATSLESKEFTWSEIKEHTRGDAKRDKNVANWIVIGDTIYDVNKFRKKHPGGDTMLVNHVGQDATDAFIAFHTDTHKVHKYMKHLEVGKVKQSDDDHSVGRTEEEKGKIEKEVTRDFRQLKELAESMNLFETRPAFFIAQFAHIVGLEALAWLLLYSYSATWPVYLLAASLIIVSQAQAGWSQHDYGHLSVFKSTRANHLMHRITIGLIKGAAAGWWNFRHFAHHAKPNVHGKDPDIAFGHLFLFGKVLPREVGLKKKGKGTWLSYTQQQIYFFMLMPPLLLPIGFHIQNALYLKKKRDWYEAAWFVAFYVRWFVQYAPVLSGSMWSAFCFYMLIRFVESFWFVYVTQMSHIPMRVDRDKEDNWFSMQLAGTCNVKQSTFNDWFTGHLNFQIEHHLFPTMPRHNYHKIQPFVQSICEKHGIKYENKDLLTAFADIHLSLKESGELWYEAYNM